MRLERRTLEDFRLFKRTKNLELLEKFRESDIDIAEIVDYSTKTAAGLVSSLNSSIKRFKIPNIVAINRDRKPYLIKLNKVGFTPCSPRKRTEKE